MTKQEAIERARVLKARERTHREEQELHQIRTEHYYALWNDGHFSGPKHERLAGYLER